MDFSPLCASQALELHPRSEIGVITDTFFFFFCLLPWHMEISGARDPIWAGAATHCRRNARSSTHRARSGIKPASSTETSWMISPLPRSRNPIMLLVFQFHPEGDKKFLPSVTFSSFSWKLMERRIFFFKQVVQNLLNLEDKDILFPMFLKNGNLPVSIGGIILVNKNTYRWEPFKISIFKMLSLWHKRLSKCSHFFIHC